MQENRVKHVLTLHAEGVVSARSVGIATDKHQGYFASATYNMVREYGRSIHRTTDWQSDRYDMIIDARSPTEFADDHNWGAVNMPAFQMMSAEILARLQTEISLWGENWRHDS